MKQKSTYILSGAITAFALLTLFLSGSVIFDLFGIREKEGNYVLFIVWANFISSLLYLLSAYGILKSKKWAYKPLVASTLLLLIALIGLYLHISEGGIYEEKTVGAMYFRTSLSIGFAILAFIKTKNQPTINT